MTTKTALDNGHTKAMFVLEDAPSTEHAERRSGAPPASTRSVAGAAIGKLAVGALAVGALACGAAAIGALAVGRLAVRRARFGRLEVDELTVGRLRLKELTASGHSSQSRPALRATALLDRTPEGSDGTLR
jgi:hypothetical protein